MVPPDTSLFPRALQFKQHVMTELMASRARVMSDIMRPVGCGATLRNVDDMTWRRLRRQGHRYSRWFWHRTQSLWRAALTLSRLSLHCLKVGWGNDEVGRVEGRDVRPGRRTSWLIVLQVVVAATMPWALNNKTYDIHSRLHSRRCGSETGAQCTD